MRNPRITPKDRNTIKGALRRAFSRSALHKAVLDAAVVRHSDPSRPRVKTWCRCNVCGEPEARSYCAVDHIDPMVPVNRTFEDMSLDEAVDRLWCEIGNLQTICPTCHDKKTAIEREHRKANRKPKSKKKRSRRK